MRTLNRHLIMISDAGGGFSGLRLVLATTVTDVIIGFVRLTLVSHDT